MLGFLRAAVRELYPSLLRRLRLDGLWRLSPGLLRLRLLLRTGSSHLGALLLLPLPSLLVGLGSLLLGALLVLPLTSLLFGLGSLLLGALLVLPLTSLLFGLGSLLLRALLVLLLAGSLLSLLLGALLVLPLASLLFGLGSLLLRALLVLPLTSLLFGLGSLLLSSLLLLLLRALVLLGPGPLRLGAGRSGRVLLGAGLMLLFVFLRLVFVLRVGRDKRRDQKKCRGGRGESKNLHSRGPPWPSV
jgi:hypothetical protein